jgi:hypothetical protein
VRGHQRAGRSVDLRNTDLLGQIAGAVDEAEQLTGGAGYLGPPQRQLTAAVS